MSQQTQEIIPRDEMMEALKSKLEIDPATTAVITIDCHRGHLDPEVATMPVTAEHASHVLKNTVRLMDIARGSGMHVIHAIIEHRKFADGTVEAEVNPFWRAVEETGQQLTPELKSTIKGHNLEGSPQTDLMPELGPEEGDVMIRTKRRLSSFRDTDLDMTLQMRGVDTVILVGINTNTCVQNAAFESMNRDLKTIVISDCVQSMYGQDLHAFGLQNIARCLGWVITLDELEEKIAARA